MPGERLERALSAELADLTGAGTAKGPESVVTEVLAPRGGLGPRYRLEGHEGDFLRMNSNSYLGLSSHPAVVGAEEAATRRLGAGPGAVRFISGTYQHHLDLERRLAGFHGRESAVVFSSAY
ncbi:MAG TPA: aminotransferase class I/II-fold pyridoxal phosphate-dependent enzyme, partial [Acidimicrobiia bacterium]